MCLIIIPVGDDSAGGSCAYNNEIILAIQILLVYGSSLRINGGVVVVGDGCDQPGEKPGTRCHHGWRWYSWERHRCKRQSHSNTHLERQSFWKEKKNLSKSQRQKNSWKFIYTLVQQCRCPFNLTKKSRQSLFTLPLQFDENFHQKITIYNFPNLR